MMYPVDVKGCVNVRGVEIAYAEAGEGQPLVCVHGNFAGGRWFTEQLQAPPPGTRVLALDLPNFADSDPMPEPIAIEAYADYLQGFIEALELDAPVLVGHSLGGAVVQATAVQAAAGRMGGGLRSLILVDSAPPGGLVTPEAHYPVLESLRGDRELMAQALTPTMPARQPDYFDELVEDALKMNPAAFTENARALERMRLADAVGEVTCPMLVIRGEYDYLVSDEAAQATAQAFPNARLERLDGVGHSPQIEDPARFGSLLREFLEGLP